MIGCKAFDYDLVNRYGMKFELNVEYSLSGELKFGNNGNGFHFCTNLEDTLRYVDGANAIIVMVEALGNLKQYDDEYNGYYDMFVTDKIKLIKILTKNEIFNYTCSLPDYRLIKMIRDYKQFTELELLYLENKYQNNSYVIRAIKYYQRNDLNAYKIF